MSSMDPQELARWTRFAMKGGIGKCTAVVDCVAESSEDLMFLKDDEIVVLLQMPELEGIFLGYCEGVIGKFTSEHVRFHSKLKKPIMAKRSSSTNPSPSSSSHTGKSPTPTFTPPSSRLGGSFASTSISSVMQQGTTSNPGTPAQTIQSLRSDSQASSRYFSSRSSVTHSRNDSGIGMGWPSNADRPHPRREFSQNSNEGNKPTEDAGQSFLTDEIMNSLAPPQALSQNPSRFSTLEKQINKVEEGWRRTASPETLARARAASVTQPNRPPPLELLDANPLRITKKSPNIPNSTSSVSSHSTEQLDSPEVFDGDTAHPMLANESTHESIPNSSFSTTAFNRFSVASDTDDTDGVMGIGLSLLQDLADGMDDSDSDDDYGYTAPDTQEYTSRRSSGQLDGDAQNNPLSRNASIKSEGTVDGLQYGLDSDEEMEEDDDDDDFEPPSTATFPMPPTGFPNAPAQTQLSPTLRQFPSKPSSLASPPTSPKFNQIQHTHAERERRPSLAPSLAPSATSVGTTATSSSWEGAGDIYDDYRYSRFSMSSALAGSLGRAGGKRMSSVTANGVGGSSDIVPPLPHRDSVDGGVSGSVSGSVGSGSGGGSVAGGGSVKDSPETRRITVRRDSDASVYSRASRNSLALSAFMSRVDNVSSSLSHLTSISSSQDDDDIDDDTSELGTVDQTHIAKRPPALNLVQSNKTSSQPSHGINESTSTRASTSAQSDSTSPKSQTSPLLHATWGSPLTSPTSSSTHGGYSPIPGMVPLTGNTTGGGYNHYSSHSAATIESTGTFGRGAASAMRQRIEGEQRRTPGFTTPDVQRGFFHSGAGPEAGEESMDISLTESERMEIGRGKRIVVEDEDELPSRVEDSYTTVGDDDTISFGLGLGSGKGAGEEDGEGDARKRLMAQVDNEEEVDGLQILPATPISAAAPPLPPAAANASTSDASPPSRPSTPPNASASTAGAAMSPPQPSHLRPSLRDLREGGSVHVPGTGERRSLFMPHPNAPKAPKDLGALESPGPMYVRDRGTPPGSPVGEVGGEKGPLGLQPQGQDRNGPGPGLGQQQQPQPQQQERQQPQQQPQQPQSQQYNPGPPQQFYRPNASIVIRQILSQPPPQAVMMPNGARRPVPRGPTIYGRTEGELAASTGPVLITWSSEPPPTKVRLPPSSSSPSSLGNGGNAGTPQGHNQVHAPTNVRASPVVHSSPLRSGSVPPGASGPAGVHNSKDASKVGKRPSMMSVRENLVGIPTIVVDKRDSSSSLGGGLGSLVGSIGPASGAGSKPIPRGNFTPKVGAVGARPRSRSFSGVGSVEPKKAEPTTGAVEMKKSTSLGGSNPIGTKTVPIRPSPLSLPQNNVTNQPASPASPAANTVNRSLRPRISTPALRTPSSPLASNVAFGIPPPPSPTVSNAPIPVPIRQSSLGSTRAASPPTGSPESNNSQMPSISSVTNSPPMTSTSPPPPAGGPVPGVGLHLRRLTTSRSAVNLRGSTGGGTSWEETHGFRPPSISSTSGGGGGSNASRPIAIPASRKNTLSPPPSVNARTSSMSTGSSPSSFGIDTAMTSPAPSTFSLSRAGSDGQFYDEKINRPTSNTILIGPDIRNRLVTSPQPSSNNPNPSITVTRQNSLKSKLSLPNLRRTKARTEDTISVDTGGGAGISTTAHSNEVLFQVQDMEFELVRPALAQFGAARASEDSGVLGRESGLESAGTAATGGSGGLFLRTDSPAFSIGSDNRSPTYENFTPGPFSSSARSVNSQPFGMSPSTPVEAGSMEAHRNREQKWMSLLGSSPPSQARKLKKVRKLLLEGVPSSVRYLVWSHLTDGKAKCVPGVYTQLCKRGSVAQSRQIAAVVKNGEWFLDEDRVQLRTLKEAGGGVVQLLEAYLNMVPDIQYSPGLPHIVGQLLLLAPEEDAFWIFVSIMDTHIRPYFASGSSQMEVDAALFSRALETNDPPIARKLLVDMGIAPGSICQPWFTSLFVGCLPADYLARTWDVFLYDGIPFLIRIGLAIVSCVRRALLECTSEEAALALLHRPSFLSLPPTPENFTSFALSIKLKDDDIRKQRIKMEAQVRRQTQQQVQPRSAGSISLPRA
ncbi:hypothetical protein FA15DRAFT_760397 [Coprinopsis marcescibilis]|uniref:Rab-GAP TBC domain-containing protein n=1 Tax=Coprinopsis marcescibilis TaxID=230819 RepID=A0A5C3KG99_COPMA|nr:hypothetical protein FA15DRAFT_760397 [Coprinopsis marcescibilis]